MTTEIASPERQARQGMAKLMLKILCEVDGINTQLKSIADLPFCAELSLIGLGEDGQYIHIGPDRSCPEIELYLSSDTSPTPTEEELGPLLDSIECINFSIDNIRRYIGDYLAEKGDFRGMTLSLGKVGILGYGLAPLSKGPIGLYRLTAVLRPGYCS